MHASHYIRLLMMSVLSFVSMYVLMYAMVDRFANVYSGINQFYMAGLMTAPMAIIELLLMGAMYRNRTANIAIIAAAIVALVALFALIRQQSRSRGHAIPAIDDPSPWRCDPDVREGANSGR